MTGNDCFIPVTKDLFYIASCAITACLLITVSEISLHILLVTVICIKIKQLAEYCIQKYCYSHIAV